MRLNIFACGLLCAGMTLQSAWAAPPLAVDVVPTVKLAWLFGGVDRRDAPLQLTAQFNYRWPGMQRPAAGETAVASDFFSKHYRSVDIVQFAGGRDGFAPTRILGHSLLADDQRLNQTEAAGAEAGGTPWYWYALGAVAVVGGVAVAASGGDGGSNDASSSRGSSGGCDIAGVNNGSPVVTHGCTNSVGLGVGPPIGIPDIP